MSDKKKSRYSYSEGQKEINRAFKMQDMELRNLDKDSQTLSSSIAKNQDAIDKTHDDVEDLIKQTEKLMAEALQIASEQGVDIPEHLKTPVEMRVEKSSVAEGSYLADEKISVNNIPSWEKIMEKTNEMVPEGVVLEELLSAAEFQYCIDDVKRINEEFAQKTNMSKFLIYFTIAATALQTARWIIIQQLCGDLGESFDKNNRLSHNDKSIKGQVNKSNKDFQNKFSDHGHREGNYKSWERIIFDSVPYDTTVGSPQLGINMEGGYHRYHTLGHDPVLGWIFGTANIMTDTITLNDFMSYNIQRKPGPRFSTPTDLLTIFTDVICSIKEDWLRLPAGIFAQGVHLRSDAYTKYGLPVPILETFSESLAGKLYKSQYDALCLLKDIKIVGMQAGLSILINMIIGLIHGLFYNKEKDGRREHYEVRTRKILLYSNAISSSLNLAYVTGNAVVGNEGEALKKLDLGGLLITLWRLFSDVRFITRVKQQFMEEELDKVTKDSLENLESMFEQ